MAGQEELTRLTATAVVDLLRRREVAPLDLVEAAAERIEAVDSRVNALPCRFLDRARDTAKRMPPVDAEAAKAPGWLGGLPIAVKDYNDVAGIPTTYGSPIFRANVPEKSDATVLALEAKGAIPLAKSNTPEFAGANTFNTVYGATRNPFDLERSAGGSSGGAAAALATGMVWLATGNDLGGSLRIPASFCGIVGLRPSVGRVVRPAGNPAFDALWVEGPMGRTVADTALMLDAEAVEAAHDPWSRPPPARAYLQSAREPRAPRRIAFSGDLGLSRVDPEVIDICRKGALSLRNAKVAVEEGCPDLSGGIEAFQTLRALMFASVRANLLATHSREVAPEIIWQLEKGVGLTAAEILAAERTRQRLFHAMVAFFERYDLLACPVVAVPPFPVTERYPTEIGGQKLTTYIDWMFLTFVISLIGCPAISVPVGRTAGGLPIGLQLIGRPHRDHEVIEAAAILEQTRGFGPMVPMTPP